MLSLLPNSTQSWRPRLSRQLWASGWKGVHPPALSAHGWTIGFSAWLYPRGAWRGRKVMEGSFYSQKPLISLHCPHYPWCLCRTLTFPRWREQLRYTYARKTPPPVGTVHASCPTPKSWHQSLLPKLTVLQARLLPPCMPWQSCRSTKSRHSNRWMRVVLIQDSCRSCIQKITSPS